MRSRRDRFALVGLALVTIAVYWPADNSIEQVG